jgi:hypothetical protein
MVGDNRKISAFDGFLNTANPVTYYVHTDHLLRPIRMSNAAKTEVWTATWTPWGTAYNLSGTAIQNRNRPAWAAL